MDIGEESVEYHKKFRGKIGISPKAKITDRKGLSLAYTPGVAQVCREIAKNPALAYETTLKSNSVAVLTDGTRVLGLGNIGALASIPVMEGKAMLFREFGGVDAYPICLDLTDEEKFIEAAKAIAPVFGGINLEDIENPKCYSIEKRLVEELGIPVMHDDQHGTAVTALAGLQNALEAAGKKLSESRVAIMGAGAAGSAIALLLARAGCKEVLCCDRKGVLAATRADLDSRKALVAKETKADGEMTFAQACNGADAIIGASAPGSITAQDVAAMGSRPIVFSLANPVQEISLEDAKKAGAFIYASGRSDLPNQINNVLAFPGIFRGALDSRSAKISEGMKLAAANAISGSLEKGELSAEKIVPVAFDRHVHFNVALAVALQAQKEGLAKNKATMQGLEALISSNLGFQAGRPQGQKKQD
ncbi:MAG: NADP-dependent malic enzyme [Candidatus Micrarchaeia archaeon]